MSKPTTIRIPEELLRKIDQLVLELKVDRSDYPSEVLRKGFIMDNEDRALQKCLREELSQMEVCREWSPTGKARGTSMFFGAAFVLNPTLFIAIIANVHKPG